MVRKKGNWHCGLLPVKGNFCDSTDEVNGEEGRELGE